MNLDVVIKTLDLKSHKFSVNSNITVEQLKTLIAQKVKIHPEKQRFLFKGKEISNEKKLEEYQLGDKSIFLVDKQPVSEPSNISEGSADSNGMPTGDATQISSLQFRSLAIQSSTDTWSTVDNSNDTDVNGPSNGAASELYVNNEYEASAASFVPQIPTANDTLKRKSSSDVNENTENSVTPLGQHEQASSSSAGSKSDDSSGALHPSQTNKDDIYSTSSSEFGETVQNVAVINNFESVSRTSVENPATLQIRIPITDLFSTEDLNGVLTKTLEVVDSFNPRRDIAPNTSDANQSTLAENLDPASRSRRPGGFSRFWRMFRRRR